MPSSTRPTPGPTRNGWTDCAAHAKHCSTRSARHRARRTPRRLASSRERARTAVRAAIAAALDRIAEYDPALARLLRDTVHTGATYRNEPAPERAVAWRLDPHGALRTGNPLTQLLLHAG